MASTLNARNQGLQAQCCIVTGRLLLFTSLVSVFNVLADIQRDIRQGFSVFSPSDIQLCDIQGIVANNQCCHFNSPQHG